MTLSMKIEDVDIADVRLVDIVTLTREPLYNLDGWEDGDVLPPTI